MEEKLERWKSKWIGNMNIYFSHAIVDYNTEYEDLCIDIINLYYPDCTIVNPKDIIVDDIPEIGLFNYYFYPMVLKCDLVFAAQDINRRKFRTGTCKEMIYAIKNNIPVVAIINDEIKEIKREFFTTKEWDNYGKQ